jgi:protein-S-isoprenylcysteine O-methyltransferase Ste14
MSAATVSLFWKIFYFGWLASEIYIGIGTRTRRGGGKVSDGGTLFLLWVVIVTSITAATWVSEENGANMPGAVSLWMRPAALGVLIFALALRWAAVLTLGKSFSSNVAIRESQTVYKQGLYRWMRHPSYTGLLLCFVAVGLHSRNWVSMLIVMVPTTAVLLRRIRVEEATLRRHFGEEYVEYSRHTSRLIPGVY